MEDFNYGTLLRLDCRQDYTEENTIFGELEPAPSPLGKGRDEAAEKLIPRICSFLRFSSPPLPPLFSHPNPVFCHRNRSEQRGLEQRRLQQRPGAGGRGSGVGVRMGRARPRRGKKAPALAERGCTCLPCLSEFRFHLQTVNKGF